MYQGIFPGGAGGIVSFSSMGIRKPSGTLGEGIAPLRGSGSRLAGLVAAMDDGTMTAYVHYLLVHLRYQGCGIGSWLPGMCKRRYAGYLRIVLTSCREKVPFYERNGFLPARTQEAVRLIPPTFRETGIEQEEGE